jgi:hypothetical protein
MLCDIVPQVAGRFTFYIRLETQIAQGSELLDKTATESINDLSLPLFRGAY